MAGGGRREYLQPVMAGALAAVVGYASTFTLVLAALTAAGASPQQAGSGLMTVCIAIGLMPILVWIPRHWLALDASRPMHAFFCGLLGGGLNLAVGVSGPTVDIFFIRTQMDRRVIVATKAATQVVSHAAKVVFYGALATAVGAGDWLLVAVAAPFAVAGTSLGFMILQRMTDEGFRKWTRWVVTAIGVFYMGRGLSLLAGG